MKDQYCGDINDFRKYGLLRSLLAGAPLSLTVCWMLTPGDGRTDGRHITYLNQPVRWRHFDVPLFEALGAIVAAQDRRIAHIEASPLLSGARFHSRQVPADRIARAAYLTECLGIAHQTDLLFFDPDNGLEIASVPFGAAASPKYLYWREVAQAWAAGHSLLIYQHFPRRERSTFVRELITKFHALTQSNLIIPIRTANVVFFLVAQSRHETHFSRRAHALTHTWPAQFQIDY